MPTRDGLKRLRPALLLALAAMITLGPPSAGATQRDCRTAVLLPEAPNVGLLAGWPSEHTLPIGDDITVYYTYPDPVRLWDQGALILYASGQSGVELNANGDVAYARYYSVEGCERLESVLDDPPLMARIRALIPWDSRPGGAVP